MHQAQYRKGINRAAKELIGPEEIIEVPLLKLGVFTNDYRRLLGGLASSAGIVSREWAAIQSTASCLETNFPK